jgi:hypothetical protein
VCKFKCIRIKWARHVLKREEDKNLKQVIIRNPEERIPRGRPRPK